MNNTVPVVFLFVTFSIGYSINLNLYVLGRIDCYNCRLLRFILYSFRGLMKEGWFRSQWTIALHVSGSILNLFVPTWFTYLLIQVTHNISVQPRLRNSHILDIKFFWNYIIMWKLTYFTIQRLLKRELVNLPMLIIYLLERKGTLFRNIIEKTTKKIKK